MSYIVATQCTRDTVRGERCTQPTNKPGADCGRHGSLASAGLVKNMEIPDDEQELELEAHDCDEYAEQWREPSAVGGYIGYRECKMCGADLWEQYR